MTMRADQPRDYRFALDIDDLRSLRNLNLVRRTDCSNLVSVKNDSSVIQRRLARSINDSSIGQYGCCINSLCNKQCQENKMKNCALNHDQGDFLEPKLFPHDSRIDAVAIRTRRVSRLRSFRSTEKSPGGFGFCPSAKPSGTARSRSSRSCGSMESAIFARIIALRIPRITSRVFAVLTRICSTFSLEPSAPLANSRMPRSWSPWTISQRRARLRHAPLGHFPAVDKALRADRVAQV